MKRPGGWWIFMVLSIFVGTYGTAPVRDARAQSTGDPTTAEKAAVHYEVAEKYYRIGEFSQALEAYGKAFALTRRPEL
ncbi:MAG: hypothetical protein CVU65_02000, partial [Deltaproteobacteria bacterium HGW-Deltaproteobacteria-22]